MIPAFASLPAWVWSFFSLLIVQAPPTLKEENAVSATITFKDVDIDEFLTKLNIKIGYKLGGKVTVRANLTLPVGGDVASSKAYVLRGTVTSPELRAEGLRVRDLSAEVVYEKGKLTLTKLAGTLPPDVEGNPSGTFAGSATAQVEPKGDASASLTLKAFPIGEVLKALPGSGVPVSGAVDGVAEFRAPVETISDPAKWVASANMTAKSLSIYNRTLTSTKIQVAVKDGVATLKDSSTVVEGLPIAGSGTLKLTEKFAFTAVVRTQPNDVNELQKLIPELEIPVAIKGKLATETTAEGTLNPLAVTASGSLALTDFAIGGSKPDTLAAKWALAPEQLTLSELSGGLFNGKIAGSATVPLKPEGKGAAKLTFTDIDAGGVATAFPKIPVRLTGAVTGSVVGTAAPTKGNEPRAINADVNITAPKLTVQGIPAEKLTGKLTVEGTALKYELEGKALGGSFEVNGRYPQAKPMPEAVPGPPMREGMLRIRGVDLTRLTEALRLRGLALAGVVDLSFDYAADLSAGSGRYSVRGFGINNRPLTPVFEGTFYIRGDRFELGEAYGPLSGGSIRARVRASLDEPARNFFRVAIERVELKTLADSFLGSANLVEGGLSVIATGKFWPEFRSSGTVVLSRGKLAGLSTTDLRVPFTVSVRGSGGQVQLPEIAGAIGDGRINGRLDYQWGANGQLDGQLKFDGVRIGNVLADLKTTNYFGNARVSGRLDLKGSSVASVDDLRGTLTARISQAAVRDLPVIEEIVPFIPPNAITKPFDTGDLRASLSRGVIRVESLALSNPNADLFAEGTVGLNGRLDLAVILRTGQIGLNDSFIRSLGTTLVPGAALPVQIIRDASVFLSNRTIRLSITGTIANPHPELNAIAILSEEAVRYLLRNYLPIVGSAIPQVQQFQQRIRRR